jgi:hypothetical protein
MLKNLISIKEHLLKLIINYSYLKVSGPKKFEMETQIHILNIMINFMKKNCPYNLNQLFSK